MKTNHSITFIFLVSAFIFSNGCRKKDSDDNAPIQPPAADDAVYVINEGAFGTPNGTIDFYSMKADSISNDIFGYVNLIPLGEVVQSMTVADGKGYICVNGSRKVEVVNMADFNSFGTSNAFQGPRFFIKTGVNTGYVSDWFANNVKVVDLTTLAVIDSIPTGAGPEQMLLLNDKVYVTNVGGFGNDSTVTVINTSSQSVVTTIEVGLNPNSILLAGGKVWVLCGGTIGPDFVPSTADDRAGSLVRIDPVTMTVEKKFTMAAADHPVKLAKNGAGDKLYFLKGTDGYKGKVHVMGVLDIFLPINPIVTKDFYGLGVAPGSGDIFGGYAPDFNQGGSLYRYSAAGALKSIKTTGIAPNGFVFY